MPDTTVKTVASLADLGPHVAAARNQATGQQPAYTKDTVHLTKPLDMQVDLWVAQLAADQSTITVGCKPSKLTLERLVSDLAHALDASFDLAKELPHGLEWIASIKIEQFRAQLSATSSSAKLQSFAMTLAMDGGSKWTPPSELLSFLKPAANSTFTFVVTRLDSGEGAAAKTSVDLVIRDTVILSAAAKADMAVTLGLPLKGGAGGPSVRAVMVPHLKADKTPEHVPLSALLDQVVKSDAADKELAGLNISRLEVSGDVGTKSFGFDVALDGPWKVLDGKLEIDALALDLSRSDGTFSGDVSGRITLRAASTTSEKPAIVLEASADFPGDGAGWQLDASLVAATVDGKPSLTLEELFDDCLKPFGKTSAHVPKVLASVVIEDIRLSFNTQSKDLSFLLDGSIDGDDISLTVALTTNAAGGHDASFKGLMRLDAGGDKPLEFELELDETKNSAGKAVSRAIALFADQTGARVELDKFELLNPKGDQKNKDALSNWTITLYDAMVAFSHSESSAANFLISLDLDGGIDLSALKLPGLSLGAASRESLKLSLQLMASLHNQTADDLAQYQALLPSYVPPLPTPKTVPFSGLDIDVRLTADTLHVDLPLEIPFGGQKQSQQQAGQGNSIGQPTGSTSGSQLPMHGAATNGAMVSTPTPATSTSPAAANFHWVPLQRTFGPVHVDKIGVAMVGDKLTGEICGDIAIGGLTMSLIDLSVTANYKKWALPSFGLDGLGISYRNGAIEIGGGLMRQQIQVPVPNSSATITRSEFNGEVVIGSESITLAALGSFCEAPDGPSLFIYGAFLEPLGGPAFFFVTGIAAGFGIHRRLVMPTINGVAQFPLVTAATSTAPPPDFAIMLTSLAQDVPVDPGESFLCAGIRFTSFKIVDTFLLLAVQFGRQLEFDLLGLSTIVVPPLAPPGTPLLAEAQLELEAKLIPEIGYFEARAQLTPASYILSPDCHLTGGFAAASWLKGEHAGDFVVTLGGYHPAFLVPKHYPADVPRLGFNWQQSPALSFKGGIYYALTGNAFMAGGSFSATYASGSVNAWFTCGADFLVTFKPFHYDAAIYIDMGAAVTIHFFGTHHLSFDAGADLQLWGPPVGGHAHVHLKVMCFKVTFDVAFGAGVAGPRPIEWQEFAGSFLHLPAGQTALSISSIGIESGLLREAKDGKVKRWIVNGRDLALSVQSAIPSTSVMVGGAAVVSSPPRFGIRPMGKRSGDVDVPLVVTISRDGVPVGDAVFVKTPITKAMPAGLWGDGVVTRDGFLIKPDLHEPALLTAPDTKSPVQFATGVRITTPQPVHASRLELARKDLAFDTSPTAAIRWNAVGNPADVSGTPAGSDLKQSNNIRDRVLADVGLAAVAYSHRAA